MVPLGPRPDATRAEAGNGEVPRALHGGGASLCSRGRRAWRRQSVPPRAPRGRAGGAWRRLRSRGDLWQSPPSPSRPRTWSRSRRASRRSRTRPGRASRAGPGRAPRRSPATRTWSSTRSTSATRAPSSPGSARAPRRRARCRSSSGSAATSRTTSTSGGARARSAPRPRTSSPATTRCGGRSTTSTRTSSASRARRARLRAAVWQSIFTRDVRRYRRALYARMGDVATLVTGPSGTGKELVARAIGLARYIPFDAETGVFADAGGRRVLSAEPRRPSPRPSIESELFGHRRGAFTGALEDRAGLVRGCPRARHRLPRRDRRGRPAIQVKLLRVLQTPDLPAPRRHRGPPVRGEDHRRHEPRPRGRRSPPAASGRTSTTASARTSSSRRPSPSGSGTRRASSGRSAARSPAASRGTRRPTAVAAEAEAWIARHLGPDYAWPGNVRELEQCVRNLVIHGTYAPRRPAPASARAAFLDAVQAGALSADAAPPPLLHVGLCADGELQRDGPAPRPRSAHGAGPGRPGWLAALQGGDSPAAPAARARRSDAGPLRA